MTAHDNPVTLTDEQLDQIIGGLADWAGRMPPELDQYPGGGEAFLAGLENYRGHRDGGSMEDRITTAERTINAMGDTIRADVEQQMKAALSGHSLSAEEIAQHREADAAAIAKTMEIVNAIVGRGMQSNINLSSPSSDLFASIPLPKR